MTTIPALLLLAVLGAPGTPQPPGVLVLGARPVGGPSVATAIASLREALSRQGSVGPVLSEAEGQARLGVSGASPAWVRERIDAAELYYFQLELPPARKNLEDALAAMEFAGGDAATRDRARVARLLFGMVRLAEGGPHARDDARAEFEKVARVEPDYQPDPRTYPPEVVTLWEEARSAAAARPRGVVRVRCTGPCARGQVWIDAVPRGVPGEAIELPAGSYRLVVTDAFENPILRSASRVVEVRSGAETTVGVDLQLDAVDASGGPALLLGEGIDAGQAALRLSASGPDVVVWRGTNDGRLHAAYARDGHLVGQGSVETTPSGEAAAAALLARYLAGAEVPAVRSGPPVAEAATAAIPTRRADALVVAGWATTGAAVILGGIGAGLLLDGNGRARSFNSQTAGAVAVSDAAGARSELGSISGEQTAAAVLLGAGVAAAACATTLFLSGGGASAP